MIIPNVTPVTVTATYLDANGEPLNGYVTFRPTAKLANTVNDVLVLPAPVEVDVPDGVLSVVLAASDDPQLLPNGWTYEVVENFPGSYISYNIQLTEAMAPTVVLSTITPSAPVTPTSQYLLRAQMGQVGGPAGPLDAGGLIPASQVPSDRIDALDGRVTTVEATAGAALPKAGGAVTGNLDVAGRLSSAGFALPMLAPARRSGWRDVSSIVTTMQAGHGWTTSGTLGGSNLNDTVTYARGSQSASITTNGAGASANLRRLAMPVIDLTGKALRLVLRCSDFAKLATLNFFIGTSGLANNYKWRFNALTASSQIGRPSEWVVVTLQWSEINTVAGAFTLSPTGVPSATSGFTDMQFQVSDKGTGAVTVWLQAVEIIDSAVTTWPKGIVSVTFDDSNSSANLARPKMDALGFRGTQYTIADAIGTAGKLTLTELRSLQNYSGWEIAGHSYASSAHTARYPTLTAQQVDDDARNLRAWLVSNGFTGDSFAYPGGQYELTSDGVPVDELVARYFGSARTILSDVGVSTHAVLDAIPAAMPHRLRGMSSVSSLTTGTANPTTLTAAGGVLDKLASNGGWLSMCFHRIVTVAPTDPAECSQADFNTVMDAIAARGITVLPVSDVIRRGGL